MHGRQNSPQPRDADRVRLPGYIPDHQLEGIERAGERGAEGACNRGGGAAADHDALIARRR